MVRAGAGRVKPAEKLKNAFQMRADAQVPAGPRSGRRDELAVLDEPALVGDAVIQEHGLLVALVG